jgi:FkbM family methyltransferase
MNNKFIEKVNYLSQNPENIASRRIRYLLKYLNFDNINEILDIGSWHLKQTIEMAEIFEFSIINAFEPNPETAQYCRNILDTLPFHYQNRISIYEIALTDYIGKAKFYPLDKNKTNSTNEGIASLSKLKKDMDGSLLKDKWVQKEIEVITDTLDNWAKKNQSSPDLIWMDVQGAELNVLQGSIETLKNVKAICTEAGLIGYYENHSLKKDIDSFMEKNNFIEIKEAFLETTWSSDKAAEADVIYINKKFMVNL